eukprot:TRINITY_DN39066_c0_g1_i1.p2 TRINITY_DN39066_c0_g1~~TRINITY_DN39066_c0_g1_i1.p2  ORF type:complete len:176 (+),score=15.14 TRINITY_DN39066_c0_g1_i1:148-675(+)
MIRTTYLDVVVDAMRDACAIIMDDSEVDLDLLAKEVRAAVLVEGGGEEHASETDAPGLRRIRHMPHAWREELNAIRRRTEDHMAANSDKAGRGKTLQARMKEIFPKLEHDKVEKYKAELRGGTVAQGVEMVIREFELLENLTSRCALWKYVTLINEKMDVLENRGVWSDAHARCE